MTRSTWTVGVLIAGALALGATQAGAISDADKCESGKNKIAGKYAACRQNAESQAIKKGVAADYTKCNEKLSSSWGKTETVAAGMCPTNLDETAMQTFITDHANAVAVALNGGGFPTCDDDLATCEADLATCGAGTATAGDVLSGETFSSSAGLGLTGTLTYCGDGIQDAGEQCDGADFDPALICGGGCEPSCRCRFVDNGNGTVTDNRTRLVWEKKNDSGGAVHDKDNVYTWASAGALPGGTVFTSFLATLNDAGGGTCPSGGPVGGCCSISFFTPHCQDVDCFAGFCDWRLPTSLELQSIVLAPFPCGISPCLDTIFGPTRTDIDFWTGSTVGSTANNAWGLFFSDGSTTAQLKTIAKFVRAVRTGA